MRFRPVVLILAVAGGSILAGCASSNGPEVTKVDQTVQRELADLAAGDGAGACALATPSGRTLLAAGTHDRCVDAINLISQSLAPQVKLGLRTAVVRKVTINAGTATVSPADITSTQGSLSGFLDPSAAPTVLTEQPDGSWLLAG